MANKPEVNKDSDDSIISGFEDLVIALIIAEVRAMIRRLQEHGEFQLPSSVQLELCDLRTLRFIKNQLRDTLRSLGGGR